MSNDIFNDMVFLLCDEFTDKEKEGYKELILENGGATEEEFTETVNVIMIKEGVSSEKTDALVKKAEELILNVIDEELFERTFEC